MPLPITELYADDVVVPREHLTKSKSEVVASALADYVHTVQELGGLTLRESIEYFWPEIAPAEFKPNWHIDLLSDELTQIAERVGARLPKLYDLIINIPPGTTKTTLVSVVFPIWCWSQRGWHWMRFITTSYSAGLALESADLSRDLVRSERFQLLNTRLRREEFTVEEDLAIKADKDTKSNFKVIKRVYNRPNQMPRIIKGGNRFSTSVGGTLTGYHGDILIVDDPVNPKSAVSDKERATANQWIDQTLSTRKTDKAITPTIMIMQRLHQDDPTGHWLSKGKKNVRHICLPGEIRNYRKQLKPVEFARHYKDDLLDPVRMPWPVLEEMEADLGQYGYAGQVGQDPTPPGGGMFKVDHFRVIEELPSKVNFLRTVRYWDKAATAGAGAYTVGVKMSQLTDQRWVVHDVVRGQWATDERERIIQSTAQADGGDVKQYVEQEPGSGGKDSAQATMTELSLQGSASGADRPTGDKTLRADTFSVQVNRGRVWLLRGEWNAKYIDEFRYFPHGTYKDQVDASSGAFKILSGVKRAGMLGGGRR